MNNEGSALNPNFTSTSTVRPRNRRLISYNDELEPPVPLEPEGPSSQARLASPYSSRGASPVPRTHLPRPEASGSRSQQLNGVQTRKSTSNSRPLSPPTNLLGSGIWETSWSSLQGIASSLLGSDTAHSGHESPRHRSPMRVAQWRNASKSSQGQNKTWGPNGDTGSIVPGNQDERQALVQAKKREVLMRAETDQIIDSKGKYKRRDSDGRQWSGSAQQDADEETLVYIHRVKPGDTLAGVMIKYGCQPAAFRKVNRLWPNDNIQIRDVVLLPIEACSVRGKKIDSDLVDLLDDNNTPTPVESASNSKPDIVVSSPQPMPNGGKQDQSWKHEYFVRIEGSPESVEIGRVSRRTLGFFPPSRRKSVTFSDLSSINDDSRKPSLELSRQLSNTADITMSTSSPIRVSIPIRPSRHRSSSSVSNSQFLSRLRGPGGVGNLTGRTAIAPGPAPDSLNRIFAPHLPNVEPPDSLSFLLEDDDGFGSHTSRASSTSGLENVGGAIEGWMRKVAGKVASSTSSARASSELQRKNAANLIGSGWAPGGMGGDLIELGETPLEFQDDDREGILGFPQQQSTAVDQDRSLRGRSPYKARKDTDTVSPSWKDD